MKKILSFALCFAIVFSIMPLSSLNIPTFAAETVTDDQGVTYTLSNDGTYYIVTACDTSATEVIIPAEYNGVEIKKIGDDVFYECTNLTSVSIPNTVISIGEGTFEGCTSLKSIEIPRSVTSIDNSAFYNCLSLESIEIPNSVTSIGDWSFSDCDSLSSVKLGEGITYIGDYSFSYCENLGSIEIPDTVEAYINYRAFHNSTGLTSIKIGNSVTGIGEEAFEGCTSLETAIIGGSVTEIGTEAFRGCLSLESIEIPNSVTNIGDWSFSDCDNLIDIYCETESAPEGWDTYWRNGCTATVHWGEKAPTVIFDIQEDTNVNINPRDAFESGTVISVKESIADEVKETIKDALDTKVTIGGYNGTIFDLLFGGNVKNQIFDFTAEKDGENIQPKAPITVNFGIPGGYSDKVSVYYLSPDGTMEKIKSTVDKENEKVCATLEHFSYYVLIDEGDLDNFVTDNYQCGDINGNNKIDMTDYILLKRAYFGTYKFNETQNIAGDINKNNKIDMTDYILLKRAYFGTYTIK